MNSKSCLCPETRVVMLGSVLHVNATDVNKMIMLSKSKKFGTNIYHAFSGCCKGQEQADLVAAFCYPSSECKATSV